jgi:hypothetical protein
MAKKTKALSGASQDAYFRRVLKAHANLPSEDRDQLVRRLRQEIAQLRLRAAIPKDVEEAAPSSVAGPIPDTPAPAAIPPFDPFSPNVIVVVRKAGRNAALALLGAIERAEHLRLLAREQRLTVPADLASPSELRAAIVAAAERRIANRMAAAS